MLNPASNPFVAGQRMIVGFDGTALNGDLKFLIGELGVAGVILFARNIESPDQVRDFTRSLQEYARECGMPPLIVAIDQEGGTVARLKAPFPQFPQGNPGMETVADAASYAELTASGLLDVGVNMNMAPVMDVEPEGVNGVMAKRVFRGGPERVADMGTTVIRGFQARGLMAVAKHFPGIGRTTLDSHLTLPELDTPEPELAVTDFVPFEAAIRAGVSGIMLSHIQYNALDSKSPASLSPLITADLLRRRMGYDGLVMTDDLDMKAIKVPIDESVRRIIAADVDIALICHKGPDIEQAHRIFLSEIERSDTVRQASLRSVERVMVLKRNYLGAD